jgi:hypothetical protein
MGAFELDAMDVVKAVEAWNPGQCFEEKSCQVSLRKYLQNAYPESTFEKEYEVGEGRADIYVEFKTRWGPGAKVIIELKYNLKDRSEYLRLLGQLQEYIFVSEAELVVVLCGETKGEWEKRVRTHLEKLASHRFFKRVFVVSKAVTARAKDGRFLPASAR